MNVPQPESEVQRAAFFAKVARKTACVAGAIIFAVSILPAADLRRATINLHAGPGGPVVHETSGVTLAAEQEVRLGWVPDSFDFTGKASNPQEVGAVWQSLGVTTTRSLFAQAGRFAASVETTNRTWVNRRLYLWILRSSDGLPIKADYSNVSAHALVTSASRSNWKVPAPESLPPDNSVLVALGEAETAYVGVRNASSLTVAAITVAEPGRTFAEWAAITIGAGDRALLGDIDADGRVNLLEYFLGGNPTLRDFVEPAVIGVKQGGKTFLEMSFLFPREIRGVTWAVEASSNLKTWVALPNPIVTNRGNGLNHVVVRDTISVEDAGGQRFLRLSVRQ